MKKVIALIILSSFLSGCSPSEVDHNIVQMRSGVAYLPNESEPFSGTATAYYPSGQKQLDVSYKDGMPTGKKLNGMPMAKSKPNSIIGRRYRKDS